MRERGMDEEKYKEQIKASGDVDGHCIWIWPSGMFKFTIAYLYIYNSKVIDIYCFNFKYKVPWVIKRYIRSIEKQGKVIKWQEYKMQEIKKKLTDHRTIRKEIINIGR